MNDQHRRMRTELFDALKGRDWEILATDEEADFFAKGRLSVYVSTGVEGFHPSCVAIFEFPTTRDREDYPYAEPSRTVEEPSVESALRRIEATEEADEKVKR